MKGVKGLGEVYGWFHIIELLAGHDVTKFEQVLTRPAHEVFMHLVYAEDKRLDELRRKL